MPSHFVFVAYSMCIYVYICTHIHITSLSGTQQISYKKRNEKKRINRKGNDGKKEDLMVMPLNGTSHAFENCEMEKSLFFTFSRSKIIFSFFLSIYCVFEVIMCMLCEKELIFVPYRCFLLFDLLRFTRFFLTETYCRRI